MERALPASTQGDSGGANSLLLRLPAVVKLTGLGRSTIYRLAAEGRFPCPVRIASRAVAWRRTDLDRWSASRPTVTH